LAALGLVHWFFGLIFRFGADRLSATPLGATCGAPVLHRRSPTTDAAIASAHCSAHCRSAIVTGDYSHRAVSSPSPSVDATYIAWRRYPALPQQCGTAPQCAQRLTSAPRTQSTRMNRTRSVWWFSRRSGVGLTHRPAGCVGCRLPFLVVWCDSYRLNMLRDQISPSAVRHNSCHLATATRSTALTAAPGQVHCLTALRSSRLPS
jgi:hypothetical protein